MISRRQFVKSALRDASLLALAPNVPGFLARTAHAASPRSDDRILVVVQLDGGNDGLNTVVPYRDDGYERNRKTLRLDASKLIRLDDAVGLHPSLTGAADLWNRGMLSIVQGVGYPNPSRSHFRSMAVWHSARTDVEDHDGSGWLGKALDGIPSVRSSFVGEGQAPIALIGRRSAPTTLERPGDLIQIGPKLVEDDVPTPSGDDVLAFVRRASLDAYASADLVTEMAQSGVAATDSVDLGARLRLISGLIKSGARARVYYTSQSSYDTHADQLATHASLLLELSSALKTFLDDLEASGLADRVAVLCFSEFGRQVAENGSRGTDHGAAGPVILAGGRLHGGLIGEPPSLIDLDDQGDVKSAIDFRCVYASVLEDWLDVPSIGPLGGRYERPTLFSL